MLGDYDPTHDSDWNANSITSASSEMPINEPRDEERKLVKLAICEIDCHGTPRMTSTMMGHVHEMRRILEEGADINEYARCTRPAWTRSARYGTGCCVSAALWVAIETGDENIFAFLLAHGASPHLEGGYMGDHAILFAAYRGRMGMVKSLLGDGADADTTAADRRTALHCAVASRYTAMARILVEAGCDIHARNHSGYTPYTACIDLFFHGKPDAKMVKISYVWI
ncbi:ankyrin [Laetiporus sulphureus 93-53]|uniref:Ankyrin n=1 Tax=Laetiporus sulphureus 93-53 TaxID=1314785 RepID=A0A165FPT2_9APHY|nr:ankyrin [Laetiporus sulphureus 93-53]KZT09293.1 ankyrin [Laetiporus sulphureus 93-53]